MRDLGRRKLRTTLTILGITIGIWALVVFGSMANKINALVEGGSTYYEGKVSVSDASGSAGGFAVAPMSLSVADEILAIDGVAVVMPDVTMLMDAEGASMSMSLPPMIAGSLAGADEGRETFPLNYAQGRALTPDDEGSSVTVLGADLARQYAVGVGDTFTIRGVEFQVVGVLEPTLTAPDQTAMVPLQAAQELFVASLPPMIRESIDPATIATTLTVYPADGVDPEVVADRIEARVAGVTTMTGNDFDEQIGSATAIFNAILIGIALISLV
ncbi:MAG: hypothetical protein A2V84_05060, partial [Chloroflexi bacterium RBG_16_70_13]